MNKNQERAMVAEGTSVKITQNSNGKKVNLRNMAMTACLVAFLGFSANSVVAQDFDYAHNGVTLKYSNSGNVLGWVSGTLPNGLLEIPDTVLNGSQKVQVKDVSGYAFGNYSSPNTSPIYADIEEVILHCTGTWGSAANDGPFRGCINLKKVTFGTKFRSFGLYDFRDCTSLDTIVFLGTPTNGIHEETFMNVPSTCKIIVPCGTLQTWTDYFNSGNVSAKWTYNLDVNNLVEAPCLNTLTVLSSDVSLGNALSQTGSGQTLTTTTPNNTSTTFSGTATLFALAKADKVFTGWSDGNKDNPRVVTVSSDTTFTAVFAECKETKVLKHEDESSFKVFPNPADNTLNVELAKGVNGTLTLFDMNGKAVLSQAVSGSSVQMDISSLSAGNYVLRLVENGKASVGVQVIKH